MEAEALQLRQDLRRQRRRLRIVLGVQVPGLAAVGRGAVNDQHAGPVGGGVPQEEVDVHRPGVPDGPEEEQNQQAPEEGLFVLFPEGFHHITPG